MALQQIQRQSLSHSIDYSFWEIFFSLSLKIALQKIRAFVCARISFNHIPQMLLASALWRLHKL